MRPVFKKSEKSGPGRPRGDTGRSSQEAITQSQPSNELVEDLNRVEGHPLEDFTMKGCRIGDVEDGRPHSQGSVAICNRPVDLSQDYKH